MLPPSSPHLLVYSPSPPSSPSSSSLLFSIAFGFRCNFIPLSFPSGPVYAVRVSRYTCVSNLETLIMADHDATDYLRGNKRQLCGQLLATSSYQSHWDHLSLFCCLLSHFSRSYQIVVLAVCVDSWLPSVFKRNWFVSDCVNTQMNGREKN